MAWPPCALQARHPRRWPPRVAPIDAPQRVLLGVAPTSSSTPILGTRRPGWLQKKHRRGCSGPGPHTIQAYHPLHLPLRTAPWEAPQRGSFGRCPLHPPGISSSALATQDGSARRGPYTLGAFHPRHWPLRMDDSLWGHRRGCFGRCPRHSSGLSSSALAILGGGLRGTAGGAIA